ncbi:NEFA-interacting nuclear protein NIP30 [Aspergillus affinis]|uniref:NEFA-interacting nuclear protein NIP30 n=1 Tax=Aspergillus affinis TaxID=1070780 RepID=UPI0022FE484E|nr:NEFA-interacting nuclear protein NIP30 [Aspergillus affinis]KAI9041564.1 NEFA-interacting nuclear protein NIP30 [Aspergillus affinis]
MSSGFVSAGTDQEPVERDDEWLRVQHELEEERKRKADLGNQDGGKSLYDVLQQNKMAKQEAFEEKIKLKNQFRSLDEDEVDFLDSIMESTRAQEAAVKKETTEQLELFRRQREEAEKALLEDTAADVAPVAEGEDWKIPARKRRREKNKELLLPGKKRKSTSEAIGETSTSGEAKAPQTTKRPEEAPGSVSTQKSTPLEKQKPPVESTRPKDPAKGAECTVSAQPEKKPEPAAKPPALSLGLAGYSSDSD